MSLPFGLNFGLGAIPMLSDAETRSISAENPDGSKGGGAMAEPASGDPGRRLGKGWKSRACMAVKAGEIAVLADIKGPGVIQHIWIAVVPEALTGCVLRMYWDDEKTPCVETPLGDFFCCGHGMRARFGSIPVAVNPTGGMNCYWPMPFRQRAKITVENQSHQDVPHFFYQITYALTDVPEQAALLHVQHRRSLTTRELPEHTILDGVTGRGHYVGTYLAWTQMSNGWWGEGEIKFFIDGDDEYPTICGTGTEDYFGGAWCFGDTYATPYLGYPTWDKGEGKVPRHGLYRWHILDPIRFKRDLKVTIQALGWWPDGTFQPLTDDIASTAYWYQTLPHGTFPQLPEIHQRFPR
ncbi:MAG: DUF2961 domain-containing protein [Phycisphaerae bacterium]|nr:DUF2961 domain-containing protein [Phycisphaerae bacterium]